MYAEVNSWSVILYGENRGEDLETLRRLISWCRSHSVFFASVYVFDLPSPSEEETARYRRSVPYVWFANRDEEEVREYLHQAGINPPSIPFKKIETDWNDRQEFLPELPP